MLPSCHIRPRPEGTSAPPSDIPHSALQFTAGEGHGRDRQEYPDDPPATIVNGDDYEVPIQGRGPVIRGGSICGKIKVNETRLQG